MNSKDSSISVICPSYNSEKFIERAINTVLNQTFVVDEIVFSDDGSIDNTVKLIENNKKKFKDKKINFILLQSNHRGPGYARNLAINASRNDWIAFLDSDDTWNEKKIEKIVNKIAEYPSINIFLHWEKFHRLSSKIIELRHGEKYAPYLPLGKQLYENNFFSTSAVFCRKNLILKSSFFDENLANGQDYDLWLKMSSFMKLHIIEEYLGNYIEEKNSITLRPYYKRFFNEIIIAIRHRKKVSILIFIKKIFKILITRQWIN